MNHTLSLFFFSLLFLFVTTTTSIFGASKPEAVSNTSPVVEYANYLKNLLQLEAGQSQKLIPLLVKAASNAELDRNSTDDRTTLIGLARERQLREVDDIGKCLNVTSQTEKYRSITSLFESFDGDVFYIFEKCRFTPLQQIKIGTLIAEFREKWIKQVSTESNRISPRILEGPMPLPSGRDNLAIEKQLTKNQLPIYRKIWWDNNAEFTQFKSKIGERDTSSESHSRPKPSSGQSTSHFNGR
jgi:hypothetical protein